jgi:hypothetical protein
MLDRYPDIFTSPSPRLNRAYAAVLRLIKREEPNEWFTQRRREIEEEAKQKGVILRANADNCDDPYWTR